MQLKSILLWRKWVFMLTELVYIDIEGTGKIATGHGSWLLQPMLSMRSWFWQVNCVFLAQWGCGVAPLLKLNKQPTSQDESSLQMIAEQPPTFYRTRVCESSSRSAGIYPGLTVKQIWFIIYQKGIQSFLAESQDRIITNARTRELSEIGLLSFKKRSFNIEYERRYY